MPNTRTCVVSFRDWDGLEHSVEVAANSLYEAAVLGLKAFRESSMAEHCGPGSEESHEVKVQQLQAWLGSAGKSPREQALKTRLQETLGPGAQDALKSQPRRLRR